MIPSVLAVSQPSFALHKTPKLGHKSEKKMRFQMLLSSCEGASAAYEKVVGQPAYSDQLMAGSLKMESRKLLEEARE